MEKRHSLYIAGESRTNTDDAITEVYNSFYMGFEVDTASGKIIDFGCTHTLDVTERFLTKIFIGQDFLSIGDGLEDDLKHHYSGSARKSILVSYRDAQKRYRYLISLK